MAKRRSRALSDYYQQVAALGGIGKGPTRKQTKAADVRAERPAHRALVQQILAHWKYTCWAYGVSPICTQRAVDPDELVARSLGGQVSLENTVASCRACHTVRQKTVGGVQLIADWDGKADGRPPRADIQGNVRAIWVRRTPAAYPWRRGATPSPPGSDGRTPRGGH